MIIGFSGKTVKDDKNKEWEVLQIEKEQYGKTGTWFSLYKIIDGPYKDKFILKCNNSD